MSIPIYVGNLIWKIFYIFLVSRISKVIIYEYYQKIEYYIVYFKIKITQINFLTPRAIIHLKILINAVLKYFIIIFYNKMAYEACILV